MTNQPTDNEWYEIKGFNGAYLINKKGDILSRKYKKERILRQYLLGRGYYFVRIGGKSETIHRLLATTFIPNPENKATVNHKNGIKTDNRLENLEWMTYTENNRHRIDSGLWIISEKHKLAAAATGRIVGKALGKKYGGYNKGKKRIFLSPNKYYFG